MSAPALLLNDVTCRFGTVTALRSVRLRVAMGEKVALVGPSGAGKSTLLSLLNGSLYPSEGDVQVLGRSLSTLSARQRRKVQSQVGTVYQQHNLVTNLSVIHNVNAGYLGRWPLWKALWSLVWPQQVSEAQKALKQLGIGDKLHVRTDRLSGGQQQRVALARVFVQDPAIVLADEPVASVDPARASDVMRLLRELGENRTLLVSLHDVELAKRFCDRIIGLRQGEVLFDLPSQAVSNQQFEQLYRLSRQPLRELNAHAAQ